MHSFHPFPLERRKEKEKVTLVVRTEMMTDVLFHISLSASGWISTIIVT